MAAHILLAFIFLALTTLARPQLTFTELSLSQTGSQDTSNFGAPSGVSRNSNFDVPSDISSTSTLAPPRSLSSQSLPDPSNSITSSSTNFVVGSDTLVSGPQNTAATPPPGTQTDLQSPTSTPTPHVTLNIPRVVGLSVGSVLVLSLIVVLCYFCRKRKQRGLLDTRKTGLGEKGLGRCPPEQKGQPQRMSTNLQHASTGVVILGQGGVTDESMTGDTWSSDGTGVHTNPTVSERQLRDDGYQQLQQDPHNTQIQITEVSRHQQPLSAVLPCATPRVQQSVDDVSSSVDLRQTESRNELSLVSSSYGRETMGGDVDLILRHIVELHGEMGQIRSQLQQLQSLDHMYETPPPPSYY